MKDNTRTPEAKAKTLKRRRERDDKRRQFIKADNAFACLMTYMKGGERNEQNNRSKTDNRRSHRDTR